MLVVVLALTSKAVGATDTCSDLPQGVASLDETGFVQNRVRAANRDPVDDNLQELAKKIHEEVPQQNVAVPSFTDAATTTVQTTPDYEDSNAVVDEIKKSLDNIWGEIGNVAGGSEAASTTSTAASTPLSSPSTSPASSDTASTTVAPSSTTNSSITTNSSNTANASTDVDVADVANHIFSEASDMKKIFDIMKEYLNHIVNEVATIIPSAGDETTTTSLGQTTTTTTTTKVVETRDQQAWIDLDDLLRRIKEELGDWIN